MASPRVLVREDEKRARSYLPPAPDFGWQLLGWLGATFFIVGMLDISLAFYPFNFGNSEWEFGTISSVFDSLPVVTLGMALLLGSAVARGWKAGVQLFAGLFALAALLILVSLVIYALNLPLAFKAVQDPMLRRGLKKAVTKAIGQGVFYPAAYVIIALKALRHASRSRSTSQPSDGGRV